MVRRTRNSVRNNTEMLDGDRTVEDWKKVPVVSLKLKCLANNIVSVGSKDELVQRLHAFHHPPPPPTAEDDEGEDVLNNPPDEIFMEEPPADNVGEQQQREETPPPEERDDNNEEDTLPWQEREQGADEHREAVEEETEAPTNEEFDAAVQVAVDKVLHEQLQGMVEEVQEARSEREVARQEMVAMREEIARLQKTASQPPRARKSTTTTPATATRKASTATMNGIDIDNRRQTEETASKRVGEPAITSQTLYTMPSQVTVTIVMIFMLHRTICSPITPLRCLRSTRSIWRRSREGSMSISKK